MPIKLVFLQKIRGRPSTGCRSHFYGLVLAIPDKAAVNFARLRSEARKSRTFATSKSDLAEEDDSTLAMPRIGSLCRGCWARKNLSSPSTNARLVARLREHSLAKPTESLQASIVDCGKGCSCPGPAYSPHITLTLPPSLLITR